MSGYSLDPELDHPAHGFLTGGNKVGVGVHDGLSTILATRHGFDFVWVSSFETSAAKGLPDAGVLDAEDMLATVRTVKRSTTLPVVVDLEIGYGEPVKIFHVVKAMVEAGAAGLCLEDNTSTKRSSLYEGYERVLASIDDHVARLRAARLGILEARKSCALIARTEALVAGRGVDEALRRAHAYGAEGADAVFVQSTNRWGADVLTFCVEWGKRTPVFLAPTKYSQISKDTLFGAGASHIIWANYGIRAAHRAMNDVFASLRLAASPSEVEHSVSTVSDVSGHVGEQGLRELEAALDRRASAQTLEESDHERNGAGRRIPEIGLRLH